MNFTTGSAPNLNPAPGIEQSCVPCAPSLPPLSESMRKTHDVLTDSNSLADRILSMLDNTAGMTKQGERPLNSVLEASADNAELACGLMHKLELMLSLLGA